MLQIRFDCLLVSYPQVRAYRLYRIGDDRRQQFMRVQQIKKSNKH